MPPSPLRLAAALLAAMLGGGAAHAAPAAPADAAELVRAVERRYAAIKSLTATFTQTFRSGELGQQVSESGRIFMRRPGQMRWDYRAPDKKVFLVEADGTTLAYVPADMTATRSRIPKTAPQLQLLMGQSDLLATFAASDVQLKDAAFTGSRQVKLVPRQPMGDLEIVYLEIDPKSLTVGRVLILDASGNESDLVLQKVEENVPVRADTFELRIPAGVDMVDAMAAGGQ